MIRFLKRESLEWRQAWSAILSTADDRFPDPLTGEVWQYMGTVYGDGPPRHEFRHRHHPGTQLSRRRIRIRS